MSTPIPELGAFALMVIQTANRPLTSTEIESVIAGRLPQGVYLRRGLPGELADRLAKAYGLPPIEQARLQVRLAKSTSNEAMAIVRELQQRLATKQK